MAHIGQNHPYIGPDNPDVIFEDLVVPSLLAAPLLVSGRTLLDAGTGVGLPGLPLALTAPARRLDLVEPRAGCIGLLHWLIDRLPPLNPHFHSCRLEDTPFHRLPRVQVVTRAALDWDRLASILPDSSAPILRWSGPSVGLPSSREGWTAQRLHVTHRDHRQELVWWGPTELFHVKQNRWSQLADSGWSVRPTSS